MLPVIFIGSNKTIRLLVEPVATFLCINIMRTVGPGFVCLLALFMIKYYPINSNKEMEKIYSELEKKNKAAV